MCTWDQRPPRRRDRPQEARWEESLIPDALSLLTQKGFPSIGLDCTLQSRLDPSGSVFGVSAEEHVPYLEVPGPSHGGVQEAQVPQWYPVSVETQDGIPKIRCVPEECRHRHVFCRPPRS